NRPLLTLWMDLAVNALFKMGRTRDIRTWFLLDEVHALHRLPAIEHGLQTARAVGGAFILGIHSFDKLAETDGENGAVNLSSLARTKLILSTADMETAEKCADFIGNREVRQMDEAYSYGYNNSRDASTITPRKEVQHLVMPDDIKELPSLHGYVKFPEGFPAARIRLTWRDYPQVAEGFVRVREMRAAEFTPPEEAEGTDQLGEDGRESDGPVNEPEQVLEEGEKTSQERAADNLAAQFVDNVSKASVEEADAKLENGKRDDNTPAVEEGEKSGGQRSSSARGEMGGLDSPNERQRKAGRDDVDDDREKQRDADIPRKSEDTSKLLVKRSARDDQESEAARESRFGYGADGQMRDERNAGDDFGMEM
ncbi:MAG: type IV secretion system DNA-binding domain-containing protein, partial [Alteraurantiacibacter sp.]